MTVHTFKRFNDGRGWIYREDGRIILEGDVKPPRTRGEPTTMRLMLADFGDDIFEAACLMRVDLPAVMAIIALESVTIKGSLHRDPKSYRKEATDYSAGLMQTLSKTARAMRKKYDLDVLSISRESLCVPRVSILCGVAYLRDRADKFKTDDGMLLQAAYNAGGLYKSVKNEWHLRTYSPDRTERFAQWYNDALEVLG